MVIAHVFLVDDQHRQTSNETTQKELFQKKNAFEQTLYNI